MRVVRCLVVTLMVLTTPSFIHAQTDAGWRSLASNRDALAVEQFSAATTATPSDWRAWLGLSYAHELAGRKIEAWSAYAKAIDASSEPDVLLYAGLSADPIEMALSRDPTVISTLVAAADGRGALGIVRAMVCERLGSYEMARDRLDKAEAWFGRIGFISTWRVIGPFDNISGSGYDNVYPPEKEDVPTASYKGVSGARVEWTDLTAVRRDGWVDMRQYYPSIHGMFYASTYVHSNEERRVHIRIGTSGSFRLMLNNVEVHGSIDEHNNDLDTYIAEVTIPRGWSHVLVKLGASEIERCNFLLRLTDLQGSPLDDITISTTPQRTTSVDPRPVRIDNPIVARLRASLKLRPDDIATAALLARCHLRNDEAIDAELVLLQALRYAPDAIVLLQPFREALLRSDKFDEATAVMERITKLRPDLAFALIYRFNEALESQNIDEASVILAQLEQSAPRSLEWYGAAAQLANRSNDVVRMRSLISRAFEDHPDNWFIASAAANIALLTPARYDSAIAVIRRHLALQTTESGLTALADFQAKSGRLDDWQRTYEHLLDLVPAAPGYLASMSDIRAAREEYAAAIDLMRRALAIAPTSSYLWHRLGLLYRSNNEPAQARTCFVRAQQFDPADFDVREALRQLNNEPSPFAFLPTANIDSIVAVAPTSVDFPNDNAVILYNTKQRVVYDGSRCETREESIIKILTIDGIDTYKEYRAWSGNAGALTFEKSVVRKADGREVPADRDGGFLVFKTLEIGDVIHVRFRTREANYGRLAHHVIDDFAFNDYVPALHTAYHLIIPKGQPFTWRTDNCTIAPSTTETAYGTHYVWEHNNDLGIELETSMPSYADVVRRLRITTVTDWREIVEWYHDVSRTKARSAYEIAAVMDSIAPRSERIDELDLIRRVYRYITTDVRYSNVPFRQSGIIPQQGRTTLITRIGDCKDVATLCIAMLAERGIKAHIVLVDTELSPNAPEPLPTTDFDHAIARIHTSKGAMYMDLTAPDIPLGCLPLGDVGAFALNIEPGTTKPLRLARSMFPPTNVSVDVAVHFDADSAHITQRVTRTGSGTASYRSSWKSMTRTELNKEIVGMLAWNYPDVVLHDVRLEGFDTLSTSLSYTLTFAVPRYMIEAGDFRIVRIPWYDSYTPNPALSYATRVHPIEYRTWIDTTREDIRIALPEGFVPSSIDRSFVRTHPAASCSVTTRVDGRTMHITRMNVHQSSYITPDAYATYRSFYNDVVEHDRRYALLMPEGTIVKSPRKRP